MAKIISNHNNSKIKINLRLITNSSNSLTNNMGNNNIISNKINLLHQYNMAAIHSSNYSSLINNSSSNQQIINSL